MAKDEAVREILWLSGLTLLALKQSSFREVGESRWGSGEVKVITFKELEFKGMNLQVEH